MPCFWSYCITPHISSSLNLAIFKLAELAPWKLGWEENVQGSGSSCFLLIERSLYSRLVADLLPVF